MKVEVGGTMFGCEGICSKEKHKTCCGGTKMEDES